MSYQKTTLWALLIVVLLTCAGCGANNYAEGGAGGGAGYGVYNLGVPF